MSNIQFKDAFSRYNVGVQVDFAEAIQLIAGNSYSAPVVINDPITLTIASGAVPGARYRSYFLADGINEPTIEDAFEHKSSSDYENTPGRINMFDVWHDGLSVIYAWSQFEGEEPVVLTDARVSAVDRSQLTLTFSADIDDGTEPAPSDFTLINAQGADTVTDVVISGDAVILTRTREDAGASLKVSYIKGDNPLKSDATGSNVADFKSRSVAFDVLELGDPVRLPNSGGPVTETANGDGWDYSVNVSNTPYNTCYARSDVALQAGEDGYFIVTIGSNDMEWGPIIGFTTDDEADWYEDIDVVAVQIWEQGHYGVLQGTNTLLTPDVTTVAPSTGHMVKVERDGTDIVFSLSTDAGETFIEFNRESGLSTAALFILVQLGAQNSKISRPLVFGDWA